MKATEQKINEALGAYGGKTLDEMLADIDIDAHGITESLAVTDEKIKQEYEKINKQAEAITTNQANGQLAIANMTDSLKEVEGLIREAREVFLHVKDNILGSDLIDSDLLEASAKFLESLHVNINEFVSVYKAQFKFVEKIKLMIFNQQQKIELMELKHKHDLELIAAKTKDESAATDANGGFTFNTDEIVKSLSKGGIDLKFDDENEQNEDDEDDEKEENPEET